MGGTVRVERDGAVAQVVFDHPERRNAISVDMWRSIPGIADAVSRDASVRAVVLRGAGEVAFVSGADISEFEQTRTGSAAQEYDAQNARAFAALAAIEKPVIALVHGFCVGGGMGLALTADLRFAADDAQFGIPAARLGLGYSESGIETLVRLVGPSAAGELFFTGRRFAAEEALRMGLVNRVVPKAGLDGAVKETADGIARNAPLTLRSVKLVIRELARPAAERDAEAVEASIRACFESDDYREGFRAFLEKRSPEFRGA